MADDQTPILILGAGYTGRALYDLASSQGRPVIATSRSPANHLASIPADRRLEFDLARHNTWDQIPGEAHVIWCFPAMPRQTVEAFAETALSKNGRLVVLGSTSAYATAANSGNATITESDPIDLTRPRVQGEEYLRLHQHAIILRVAGIYGPGRNVLEWIRSSKVGPSPRYVNLIHVEDLAAICFLALERGQPGEIYNVSDGHPRRWIDICEAASRRWGVSASQTPGDERFGKRISIEKLRHNIRYTLRHPDLYTALDAIESAQIKTATSDPESGEQRKDKEATR